MTLQKLATLIAKREGKKHEASIGDIREILKIIIDLELEAFNTMELGPIEAFTSAINQRIMRKKTKRSSK